MNKRIFPLALLAVLSTLTISCQKDTFTDTAQGTTVCNTDMYTVQYSVNGLQQTVILHSDDEYEALLIQLTALARKGYEIVFFDNNYTPQSGVTKDVVTYVTDSSNQASAWAKEKAGEGYQVRITFDEKTNLYTCIAYK